MLDGIFFGSSGVSFKKITKLLTLDFCASSKIKTFELLVPEEQLKDHSQLVWLSIWAFGRYDGDYTGAEKWVGEIDNLSGLFIIILKAVVYDQFCGISLSNRELNKTVK